MCSHFPFWYPQLILVSLFTCSLSKGIFAVGSAISLTFRRVRSEGESERERENEKDSKLCQCRDDDNYTQPQHQQQRPSLRGVIDVFRWLENKLFRCAFHSIPFGFNRKRWWCAPPFIPAPVYGSSEKSLFNFVIIWTVALLITIILVDSSLAR